MSTRDDKKVALPEPWQCETAMCPNLYTAAQLESYAAARVAEATEELQRRVAELERWLSTAVHSLADREGGKA